MTASLRARPGTRTAYRQPDAEHVRGQLEVIAAMLGQVLWDLVLEATAGTAHDDDIALLAMQT